MIVRAVNRTPLLVRWQRDVAWCRGVHQLPVLHLQIRRPTYDIRSLVRSLAHSPLDESRSTSTVDTYY